MSDLAPRVALRAPRAGRLELILGPMVSGKTSNMIYKLTRLADLGYAVGYINTTKDVRTTCGGDGARFTSHNSTLQQISPKIRCHCVEKLSDLRKAAVAEGLDVIGVDEAHFYEDLREVVLDWVQRLRKHVFVCGLDGSFRQEPIGQILHLVPEAEHVEKISSQCKRCIAEYQASTVDYQACFTIRLTGEQDPLLPGGLSAYEPVCRYHRDEHLAAQKTAPAAKK